MNWSSEPMLRGRVLRDATVSAVAADLGTVSARSARGIVVSTELVESARREGYQAGFDEGYPAGYTHGIEDAHRHIELLGRLVQRLGDEADRLAARETTVRTDIEDEIVATAMRIAEVIIGRRLEQPDERGRDAIARALALAPEQGDIVARLHPADIAVLGEAAELAPGRVLTIVPDATLSPGDCVVDVASCRVDARLQPALERAREVLA